VVVLFGIFPFLSVILRAMTLGLEALTVGGVIFRLLIAPEAHAELKRRLSVLLMCGSGLLAAVQLGYVAANSAILMASMDLTWAQTAGAAFCLSGGSMIAGAGLIGISARSRAARIAGPIGCTLILCGSVMSSHSMGRIEHRWPLAALTLIHHLASAAWIGGLPYLVLCLRHLRTGGLASKITVRFSRLAMIAVLALLSAGVAISVLYVRSVPALTGTAYGLMVLAKGLLTGAVLLLGGLNFKLTRAARAALWRRSRTTDSPGTATSPEFLLRLKPRPAACALWRKSRTTDSPSASGLVRLSKLAEAELGIGITIFLAASSLTSSPPAIDVRAGRVGIHDITDRIRPRWPRMQTPALADLSPATPLGSATSLFHAPQASRPSSFVPGQLTPTNNEADIAWSEYNHHWAGLIVAAAGILAFLARRIGWARYWPLSFLALGVFLFFRADSENWPLGPRSFWQSFQVAEVLQHRFFVLLIVAFAVFECAVQSSRIRADRAGLVFPLMCATGGALLLTHSHSFGNNIKEEFLGELSHTPLAILAVIAGWSRWLEVRLWGDHAPMTFRRILPWIWPVCFILIGSILLNYREA
jgi:copper resistance protein D